MIKPAVSRRRFNHASLVSLLAAVAATPADNTTSAQPQAASSTSTWREVIKQELPGEPPRDLGLVEVTYPPGHRFPAAFSCQWCHGIRRFRHNHLEGWRRPCADVPGRRGLVGTSGRGSSSVTQRKFYRAGETARDLRCR